jgi:hypothetical protein
MLVRLLLLRWLSPTLFRVRMVFFLAMLLLFLAFAGECLYLMLHALAQPSQYPPIHSTSPSSVPRR